MPRTKLNVDLNGIRDHLQGEYAEIAVGTDGTAPVPTDTTLGAEVAREASTGSTGATGEVTHAMRLGTGDANGESLREAGNVDSLGALRDRITHAVVAKTSAFEVEYRIKTRVVIP